MQYELIQMFILLCHCFLIHIIEFEVNVDIDYICALSRLIIFIYNFILNNVMDIPF